MSLINKMLQDLDKRHAADGGGKTPAPQLRPVKSRRDWRRISWELGLGLFVAVGWGGWVLYQIYPRPVVTDLAFQAKARRAELAVGLQQSAAPAPPVPVQAAAPQPQAEAATSTAVVAPAVPATGTAMSDNMDMLKLATEIATPFKEHSVSTKPKAERNIVSPAAPASVTANREKTAPPTVTPSKPPASREAGPSSIDKQIRVATPAERAEDEFRKATRLLNQGRVAEAIDGYKSTLVQDARHVAARQALVGLLLENRRLDEAQQFLREGLSLNPDRSAYAMLLARIQVERGDLQGAHDMLNKHAGSAAGDADYHAFDAALLQRLGRYKEAVAGYQAALRLAPRAGLWWMGMGIAMQADKRDAEALDAFRRARAVGGLSPDLLAFVDQRLKQLQ